MPSRESTATDASSLDLGINFIPASLLWNINIVQQELIEAQGQELDAAAHVCTAPNSNVAPSLLGARPMELGESLEFGPLDDGADCEAAIIWLHGLGERPQVWASSLKTLRAKGSRRWKWVHLRAPKLSQPCYFGHQIPAWGKFASAARMHVGSPDHEDPDMEGYFRGAARAVRKAVQNLHEADGVPAGRVLIGGFSQGGALALQIALSFPTMFAGCVVVSGWSTPFARAVLGRGLCCNAPPVLMCHDAFDALVGIDCAEFASAALSAAGVKLQFERTSGLGHASSLQVLKLITAFVLKSLGGTALSCGTTNSSGAGDAVAGIAGPPLKRSLTLQAFLSRA